MFKFNNKNTKTTSGSALVLHCTLTLLLFNSITTSVPHIWKSVKGLMRETFSRSCVNSLATNIPHHIESIQLICIANKLTGFNMMENIGR